MGKEWPEVPIGAVAGPVQRLVEPVPGVIYRQIGVRLWGQGAYERESMDGGATKYKTLNRVEAGDIIVNKIWARNGSVAMVPDELAGCHGSGEFPTFAVAPERLLPRWFHWATRTRWFSLQNVTGHRAAPMTPTISKTGSRLRCMRWFCTFRPSAQVWRRCFHTRMKDHRRPVTVLRPVTKMNVNIWCRWFSSGASRSLNRKS